MSETKLSSSLLRLPKTIFIAQVVTLIVVCLICWLTRHLTFFYIGNGLVYTGAGVILLGTLFVTGSWSGTRTFQYHFSQSAGNMDLPQRTR